MALVHAAIGLGEAIITGLVVRFLLVRRPDLFELADAEAVAGRSAVGADGLGRPGNRPGGGGVPLAVCLGLSPTVSNLSAKKLGFLSDRRLLLHPCPYRFPITSFGCRAWTT